MYLPAHFRMDDRAEQLDFMRAHSFATLITVVNEAPFASHIPLLIQEGPGDQEATRPLYLRSHLARANEQWQHFGEREVLIIFQGPHALVNPAWYTTAPNVPTWNYTALHAYGHASVVSGEGVQAIARGLVQQHTPEMTPLTPEVERKMLLGVVTFEVQVTRLEGKYKLSQNKAAADQLSVERHLAHSPHPNEQATAQMMRQRRSG